MRARHFAGESDRFRCAGEERIPVVVGIQLVSDLELLQVTNATRRLGLLFCLAQAGSMRRPEAR
jgi:hypothetical protein